MQTTDQPTEAAPAPAPPPLRQPLHPAHPDAATQPILVANMLDGTPTWVYPNPPKAETGPRFDPMAQRIMAAGLAAPLMGYGANLFFGAMAGATTALGYLAICLACAAYLRANGSKGGNNINIRIDNRGR